MSNITTTDAFNSSSSVKSPWILTRLIDSFSNAILAQSMESGYNAEGKNTFLSYWISPFALMCMTTAMILNRIVIFASIRRNRKLPLISNILLRSFALYILFQGSYGLLVSLKTYCDSPIIKFILNSGYFTFNEESFAQRSFLSISYGKHFFKKLITRENGSEFEFIGPTTTVLKPFHLSLCLSQILETFISVASGLKPSMETGITLFEYSLAFQEAQTIQRPPVELIIIALIALGNQLNTHILGLLNLTNYRLIPSTIIGLFTLSFYAYNFLSGKIFYVPFIIIVGYFPHFIVLSIVLLSQVIFLLTALFKFSFNDLTMTTILNNLASINVSLSDDFYTALINFGEFIINASISQCYVKEVSSINLPSDNYISTEYKKFKAGLVIGYGTEILDHPELLKNKQLFNAKDKNDINSTSNNNNSNNNNNKSWLIIRRIKLMNKLIKKFLILIKTKMLMSEEIENRDTHEDDELIDILTTHSVNSIRESDGKIISDHFDVNFGPQLPVDVDKFELEELEDNYSSLLLNTNIIENDTSPDYILENEGHNEAQKKEEKEQIRKEEEKLNEEEDYDHDYDDDYDGSESESENNDQDMDSAFNELINPHEFTTLLIPTTAQDIFESRIMNYHMQHFNDDISHLTRSQFAKYYVDDLKLLDLIREKSIEQIEITENEKQRDNHADYDYDRDDDHDYEAENSGLGTCVICHENSRQVILWPCKCLAICESCRVSLFVREFSNCVCCRSKVEGYSKVYIP